MFLASLVSLLLATRTVAGLPQQAVDGLVEHERAAVIPAAWKRIRSATADDVLTLRIAVKNHRKLDQRHILARSDPNSPLYGKYLGAAELNSLLDESTSPDARQGSWDRVRRWVGQQNVNVVGENARGIEISLSAREAESLLGTSFSIYSKDGDDTLVARTEAYSLPLSIRNDVEFVYPTIHFFQGGSPRDSARKLERRQRGLPQGPFDCSKYNCPVNISAKYNIDYIPESASASKLAVAGFLEQYPSTESWKDFISKYGLSNSTNQAPFNVVTLNGGKNPDTVKDGMIEAQLDLEYTSSFTGPLNVTYYMVGGRPPTWKQPGNITVPESESDQEPYLEFLDFLLSRDDVPQVISISYTDDEQSVPRSYADQVCDRFGQLAMRGVSVLVASGDAGPRAPASASAWARPASHASSRPSRPRVRFSNYYARPEWQKAAVEAYLPHTGIPENPHYAWNSSGRGYPDLTLLGTDYLITNAGSTQPAKGTSASTPVVASMIALLNDIRLRKGMPVLGFLNPLLYSSEVAQGGFTDITEGVVNGCSSAEAQQPGFTAAAGWDAASGLGAPDFAKLRKLLT
ncbi:tripeptidyl-peptidase 1 [Pyricularia oryzae Y34]|uniref:Tripeptidyl-peptidase 1 n=1 Tax=Pyricularia oryzae (strain Y34) TaxID=1143189 RepID=A0AA97NRH9_PYRO3|nr:tripeptidyl-peptidase 1 [Pyricularia oryzae Y34]